jgi:hydroxypyruvate isomerase
MNSRRQVLTAAGVTVAALVTDVARAQTAAKPRAPKRRFRLRYAPHFGQFKAHAGEDHIDQIKFMADQGFTALEDNGMRDKPPERQEAIRKEMDRVGMTMGIFVTNLDTGFKPSLATGDPALRDQFLAAVRDSVEVAKRVNAKWVTTLTGNVHPKLPFGYQFANVIEAVKRAAEICEPSGLVMVFEPLNFRDHPGFFLNSNHLAYAMCKAVASPSCKILFDLYHTQVNEGDLIPHFDRCYDEIAYIQTGDTPGRVEPGAGEVNYRNVFRHIHAKGYKGILGMEHGASKKGKEGEKAVIDAYVWADAFPAA